MEVWSEFGSMGRVTREEGRRTRDQGPETREPGNDELQ